jgi:hypothetical protein
MTAGRACYGAFTPEVLEDYIRFHMLHGTLAWVREGQAVPGGWQITGVAMAWQCQPEDLFTASLTNRHVFNWQPDDPHGRAIFIADVVATTPQALSALLKRFTERFPRWRELPLYTFRHGKVVYLTPRTLARLWKSKLNKSILNTEGGY